jgi:hypothetical protein
MSTMKPSERLEELIRGSCDVSVVTAVRFVAAYLDEQHAASRALQPQALRSSPPPAPPAGVADESAAGYHCAECGGVIEGGLLQCYSLIEPVRGVFHKDCARVAWARHKRNLAQPQTDHPDYVPGGEVIDAFGTRKHGGEADPPAIERVEGMQSEVAGLDGVVVKEEPMIAPGKDWCPRCKGPAATDRDGKCEECGDFTEAPLDAEDAYLSGQEPAVARGSDGDDKAKRSEHACPVCGKAPVSQSVTYATGCCEAHETIDFLDEDKCGLTMIESSRAWRAIRGQFNGNPCSKQGREILASVDAELRKARAEGYEQGKMEEQARSAPVISAYAAKADAAEREVKEASSRLDAVLRAADTLRETLGRAEAESFETKSARVAETIRADKLAGLAADMLCELKTPSAVEGYVERASAMLDSLSEGYEARKAEESPLSKTETTGEATDRELERCADDAEEREGWAYRALYELGVEHGKRAGGGAKETP